MTLEKQIEEATLSRRLFRIVRDVSADSAEVEYLSKEEEIEVRAKETAENMPREKALRAIAKLEHVQLSAVSLRADRELRLKLFELTGMGNSPFCAALKQIDEEIALARAEL